MSQYGCYYKGDGGTYRKVENNPSDKAPYFDVCSGDGTKIARSWKKHAVDNGTCNTTLPCHELDSRVRWSPSLNQGEGGLTNEKGYFRSSVNSEANCAWTRYDGGSWCDGKQPGAWRNAGVTDEGIKTYDNEDPSEIVAAMKAQYPGRWVEFDETGKLSCGGNNDPAEWVPFRKATYAERTTWNCGEGNYGHMVDNTVNPAADPAGSYWELDKELCMAGDLPDPVTGKCPDGTYFEAGINGGDKIVDGEKVPTAARYTKGWTADVTAGWYSSDWCKEPSGGWPEELTGCPAQQWHDSDGGVYAQDGFEYADPADTSTLHIALGPYDVMTDPRFTDYYFRHYTVRPNTSTAITHNETVSSVGSQTVNDEVVWDAPDPLSNVGGGFIDGGQFSVQVDGDDAGTLIGTATRNSDGTANVTWQHNPSGNGDLDITIEGQGENAVIQSWRVRSPAEYSRTQTTGFESQPMSMGPLHKYGMIEDEGGETGLLDSPPMPEYDGSTTLAVDSNAEALWRTGGVKNTNYPVPVLEWSQSKRDIYANSNPKIWDRSDWTKTPLILDAAREQEISEWVFQNCYEQTGTYPSGHDLEGDAIYELKDEYKSPRPGCDVCGEDPEYPGLVT